MIKETYYLMKLIQEALTKADMYFDEISTSEYGGNTSVTISFNNKK